MATHAITTKPDPQANRIFNRYSNMKFPKYSFEEYPKMLTLDVDGKPVRQTVRDQEEEEAYLAEYSPWKQPAPVEADTVGKSANRLPLKGNKARMEAKPTSPPVPAKQRR